MLFPRDLDLDYHGGPDLVPTLLGARVSEDLVNQSPRTREPLLVSRPQWCGERGVGAAWRGATMPPRSHKHPQPGPHSNLQARQVHSRTPFPTPRQEREEHPCQPGRCAGDAGQTSPAPGTQFPFLGLSSHPAHCSSQNEQHSDPRSRSGSPLGSARPGVGSQARRELQAVGHHRVSLPALSAAPALALPGGRV